MEMLQENWIDLFNLTPQWIWIPFNASQLNVLVNNIIRYLNDQSGQPARKDQAKGYLQDLSDILLAHWPEANWDWDDEACSLENYSTLSLKNTTCNVAGGREQRELEIRGSQQVVFIHGCFIRGGYCSHRLKRLTLQGFILFVMRTIGQNSII